MHFGLLNFLTGVKDVRSCLYRTYMWSIKPLSLVLDLGISRPLIMWPWHDVYTLLVDADHNNTTCIIIIIVLRPWQKNSFRWKLKHGNKSDRTAFTYIYLTPISCLDYVVLGFHPLTILWHYIYIIYIYTCNWYCVV